MSIALTTATTTNATVSWLCAFINSILSILTGAFGVCLLYRGNSRNCRHHKSKCYCRQFTYLRLQCVWCVSYQECCEDENNAHQKYLIHACLYTSDYKCELLCSTKALLYNLIIHGLRPPSSSDRKLVDCHSTYYLKPILKKVL